MRLTVSALLVVTVLGCRRERPDPRVAEVSAPAHVVVRVVDLAQKVDCGTAGDWKDQLACRVKRAPRLGCTYVEVGADADAPLMRVGAPDPAACSSLGEKRVLVLEAPNKKVEVEFDDAGTRAAVLLNGTAWFLYLHDGQLLEARHQGLPPDTRINEDEMSFTGFQNTVADGGVNWSMVPPRLAVIPTHVRHFAEADIDTEFKTTPDAQRIFNDGLALALQNKTLTPRDTEWSRMARRLDERGHQTLRDSMLAMLREGDDDALEWAEADEGITRDQLVAALEEATSDMQNVSPLMVDALFRLKPESAAPLACAQLESTAFNDDYYSDDYSDLGTALGLIAKYKVKCPWVKPMLMRVKCSASLRHLPTGKETADDDDLPLASEKEQARALKLLFVAPQDYTLEDDEFLSAGVQWGWLLLAAAEAQGPLPEEFVKTNARRVYRRVSSFTGNTFDDPCTQETPASWACRVPLEVTSLSRYGCAMQIDDAAKTLRLGWKPQAD